MLLKDVSVTLPPAGPDSLGSREDAFSSNGAGQRSQQLIWTQQFLLHSKVIFASIERLKLLLESGDWRHTNASRRSRAALELCRSSPVAPPRDSVACGPPGLHNGDLCDLCCAGRPHVLQAKSLRLWGPGPGPLLLPRLRQQTQQSVPGPERTHPLPQRSVLAVRLPAVPLPGQYTEPFRLALPSERVSR